MSKIEFRGFKSFGNAKVALPLSKGLTAIIGPNGSGKSNIVDAFCFVLGGMSAKTMRAERLSGLLFNGGNGQRPAPLAEVSIHFDNEDGVLPINSKIVAISRRVDRSGKCVYRINKGRASRQEIVDLLASSMSSPGGYNFVMQGDVDRFIKIDPIELRGIIDDLAGVAEYDEKKQRSLAELQRVQTNLDSMDAILREISAQMEKLRSERESAIRHRELTQELKDTRAALLAIQRVALKKKLSLLQHGAKAKEIELQMLRGKRQGILAKTTDYEREIEHLDLLLEEKQNIGALSETGKIHERLRLLNEMLNSLSGERTKTDGEIAKISECIKKIELRDEHHPIEEMVSLSSRFDELYRRFNALIKAFDLDKSPVETQRVLRELSEVLEELHSVLDELSENLKLISRIPEDKRLGGALGGFETGPQLRHLVSLEAVRTRLDNELKRLKQQIRESQAELDRATALEEKERSDIRDLREKREKLRRKASSLKGKAARLEEEIDQCSDELQTCRVEEASLQSQLQGIGEGSEQLKIGVGIASTDDPDKLKLRVESLEAELKALEPVNFRAIQEFRKVERRYNSEKLKYEKLEKEKETIVNFMQETDEKKKEVFMKTFNEISKHFSEIFSELSPSGVGRLILENEGSPFDGGLEIKAKPAGKEITNIEALSGGEKALTALAFIFALQRFRPTAFYVLDEIDAHLDPQNLQRVAEFIRRSSRESQVILVTLRDSMMSVADRLFGVTMDKSGVSGLVSVDLTGLAA